MGLMNFRMRRGLVCVGVVTFLSVPALCEGDACAQAAAAASERTEAEAHALFYQGQDLFQLQRYDEACVLFRKSLELKRSPGILNNVGWCLEREGEPAHALELYHSSAALAEQQAPSTKRDSWLKAARGQIDLLEPRVARLVLRVPDTPDLQVTLDGKPLRVGADPVYLEPGPHELKASAPGRVPHGAELLAVAGRPLEHEVPTLDLIPLQKAPSDEDARVTDIAAVAHETSTPVLPWALVGTGAAAITAGIVTGVMTSSKAAQLEQHCPEDLCPSANEDPGWGDKIDSAKTLALVTDVLWAAGLAAVGVGVTLLVLSDGDDTAHERAELEGDCSGAGCGLSIRGSF